MKQTITVVAYRRPDYLKRVLDSLSVALERCPSWPRDNVIIGVDPGAAEFKKVLRVAESYRWPIIVWPEHLGVNEHPRRILQVAFTELHSDFNLHLEDDTVLSPDALRLAQWYINSRESRVPSSELGLCLYSPSKDKSNPGVVHHTPGFSAWGWGCTSRQWLFWLSPYWNHRRDLPIGWDWSIGTVMDIFHLHTISPILSRVRNIGRERGQYQTPEGYDRDFAGCVSAEEDDMRGVPDFQEVK